MKNKIKLKLATGHDKTYKEPTKYGIVCGKDIEETVYLTKKEAQKLLQEACMKMDYAQSQKFVKEYK